MKNLKKVLALLLAAMMVMGLLSACTKTEEPAAEPTQEASQEETKEESKAEESKAEESKAEESKAEESKEEEPVATDTSVTPRNETFYLTTGQWGTIINNNGFSSNTNNTFCGNNSFTACELQFETLYMFNLLKGSGDPLLADGDPEFDADNNMTIHLKPAAAWSDGTPLTAEDVKATFDTHMLVNSNAGVAYAPYMASCDVVDEHTVVFHPTENVNVPQMMNYINGMYVFQKAYLDAKLAEYGTDYEGFKNDLMYDAPHSGPYDLTINNAQAVGVTRRDTYWGQDASMWGKLPVPKYIVHNIYADNNAQANALRVGESDMGQTYIANVQTMWLDDGLPVSTYYPEAPYHVAVSQPTCIFNTTVEGLDQVAVRKAIALAVDYDQILSAAMTNQAPPFSQYPRMLFQPNDEIRATYCKDQAALEEIGWLGNDVEGAIALLDEAGVVDTDGDGWREWPAGNNLSFQASCPTGWSDWQASMTQVSEAGAKIGIQIETYFPESAQWSENLRTGNFTITMNSYGGGPSDPWNSFYAVFYNYHSADNYDPAYLPEITLGYSRYSGEYTQRANELLDQAAKTTDIATLQDIYQELNVIYLTEVPSFALMYRPQLFHEVNESVWTNFPAEGDGISPTCCIFAQGVAALYQLELVDEQ
ncbi:MAG: ABC transporter substrate-binding protein [Firmicutes bacterium]|nr:ABC transporter substrate-binding protein [Bacillota bacterium]